jgi:hypothetical protein
VFGTEAAARRHVDAALWELRVEPLPVYASYEECPPQRRGRGPGAPPARLPAAPGANDGGFVRSGGGPREPRRPAADAALEPWGEAGAVVYGVCEGDPGGWTFPFREVGLFYETQQAAQEHVAGADHMTSVAPFTVHGRYEDCPPDRRFDSRDGPRPHSQAMALKPGA